MIYKPPRQSRFLSLINCAGASLRKAKEIVQRVSLPRAQVLAARQQIWAELTAAGPERYTFLVCGITEPVASARLAVIRGTRPLKALWNTTGVLHSIRWGSCLVLATVGLAVNGWFLVGVPAVLVLDRAVVGHLQVRVSVELAARLEVFNDLMREDAEFRARVLDGLD
jgi:hypothetical protein